MKPSRTFATLALCLAVAGTAHAGAPQPDTVTVTVTVELPAVSTEPIRMPSVEIDMPSGRSVADQASELVEDPPVATRRKLYSCPTTAGGIERVTMVSGSAGSLTTIFSTL